MVDVKCSKCRITLAAAAAALAAGMAAVSVVSYADTPPATSTLPAPARPATAPPRGSSAGGILDGVHDALASLVVQGSIDPSQAAAVQQEADAGSIDPETLLSSGVLSAAQMQVVGNAIDHVKQPYTRP